MKTIGFYSYKGGTGKSLAAASLAVCLSRLGKSCVLVDFDVEAPSLHNKFFSAGRGAIGKGGFIELMASHFEPEDWSHGDLSNIHPKPITRIERFLYQLGDPWDPHSEREREGAGTIHLLPAGDVHRKNYWNIIWSPLWHELFTAYQRFADSEIDTDCYKSILDLFLKIKEALAALDPAPDYMILDFRPGATELSTTLINAWVDTLIYTFAFNEDNIDYLVRTFHKLVNAGMSKKDVAIPFDIKVALSRIPTTAEYRGDRLLFAALRGMDKDWDDLAHRGFRPNQFPSQANPLAGAKDRSTLQIVSCNRASSGGFGDGLDIPYVILPKLPSPDQSGIRGERLARFVPLPRQRYCERQ